MKALEWTTDTTGAAETAASGCLWRMQAVFHMRQWTHLNIFTSEEMSRLLDFHAFALWTGLFWSCHSSCIILLPWTKRNNHCNNLLTQPFPVRFIFSMQLTFQRPERPTVRVSNAESTLNTELPNTRLVRLRCTPKVREDMTGSNPVTVVKPSQFSTRKPRPPRRSSWDWNVSAVRQSFN